MISIIVPVYKVEPYLNKCIESIINQTNRDLEIILIDDGSPDACGLICEEFAKIDKRIKVLHTENQGLSAARNIGVKEASGDYIGFVDADDWIELDMYEVLLEGIKKSNADICECSFWYESSGSEILRNAIYRNEESLIALHYGQMNDVVWNKLYKREIFKTISFPEGHNCEDIFTMHLVLARAKKVIVLSDLKYHYRQRPGSIRFTYSANNLIDYANAFLCRYRFYRQNIILENSSDADQLLPVSMGISKLWRWWYGCDYADKLKYKNEINSFMFFTRNNLPLFGFPSWPGSLRLASFFMHTDSEVSFLALYCLNQLFRKAMPSKGNVVANNRLE